MRRVARWASWLVAGAVLLQTGACVQIAQRAVINGFFDGFNPFLIDYATRTLP